MQKPRTIKPATAPGPLAAPDDSDVAPAVEEFEQSAADRVAVLIRAAVGEGDERAEVRVYKVRDGNELSWCENYKPEVFEDGSLELIRKKWGPGRFHIRLYGTLPGSKRFVVRASETVTIEAPLMAESGASDNALAALLQKMDQRLERLEVRPAADPQAQIAQTLGLMKAMREAMGAAPLQGAAPLPATPVNAINELSAMLGAVKLIREQIEPRQIPDDPLSAMLPKLLEIIGAATENKRAGDAAMPQLALPMAMQDPPANPVEDEAMLHMNAAVALLNARAARNADPVESAEMVYENAPDALLELLAAPNWFETLAQFAPAIGPHRAWYSRLRARVLEIEREETAPAPAAPPPVAPVG